MDRVDNGDGAALTLLAFVWVFVALAVILGAGT